MEIVLTYFNIKQSYKPIIINNTYHFCMKDFCTIFETRFSPIFPNDSKRSIDAPRCKDNERREITVARHETVLLKCEVEALPDDYVRFSWTYNGTVGDVLPMPNSRVENKGLVSTIEYTPNAETDYGTLACWASNSIGRQRTPCIFNIVPASELLTINYVISSLAFVTKEAISL